MPIGVSGNVSLPMHTYLISGLNVSSEVELPGAVSEPLRVGVADVSIRRASVPTALLGATASGPSWEMAGESFLLRIPGVGRFQITAGRDIAAEIEPGVSDHDAAVFVLGSAIGVVLHQRGALVLHGSAVAKNGCSVAICGASGAGKSTLAAALCREGCTFVTDDICVIGLDGSGRPMVLPDGRKLKLWNESIDRLDLGERRGQAVRAPFEKYYISPTDIGAQPSRLFAIYVLREADPSLKVQILNLALPDAMRVLDYETYRPEFRAEIGQKPEMLAQGAAVLGHVKVFLLIRPRGFGHFSGMLQTLQAHWASLD
jgi:hypothetical protein